MIERLRVVLIMQSEEDAGSVRAALESQFKRIDSVRVDSLSELVRELDSGDCDILLSDCQAAELQPDAVFDLLKTRQQDIPLIVVTREVTEDRLVELMRAGATDVILQENLVRLAPAVHREVIDAQHREARRIAEASLRENRRFFSSLLQTLPGMIYRCDINDTWTMRFISQSCLELTGYDPFHLINNNKKSFAELIHPDDRDRVWREVKRDVDSHRPFQLSYRIVTASNDIRWVMDHGRAVFREQGVPELLEGYIFDITSAKQTELALEESRARFQTISDSAYDAIIMLNRAWQVVYWNRSAERLFGYSDREMLGRSLSGHLVSASGEASPALLFQEEVVSEASGRTFDMIVRPKSGETFPVEVSVSATAFQGERHSILSVRDVTERKRALAALQESEEKFRLLVQESLEGICVLKGRNLLFVNPRFTEIFGYTEGELLATNFSLKKLLPPDATVFTDFLRHVQRNPQMKGRVVSFRGLRRTGEEIELETSVVDIRYGGERALLGMLRDVTQRKADEETLRRSEEQFRLLAENAQDVIFRYAFEPEPHYDYMSPAVERISGYSPEEFYQDPELSFKLIHPEDLEMYTRLIQSPDVEEEPVLLRWVSRDGSTVYAEQRNVLVRDETDKPVAIEGIIRDVTRQHLADEELRVRSHVIEKSPVAILITDVNGRIQFVNRRFCEVSGYSVEEVIGKNPNIVKSGKHPREFYQELWGTVLGGEVWRGELTNRNKAGQVYTESAIIAPVMDEKGVITHFFALKVDISEKVRLLEEKERLEGELARQFHLSQVGLLASGIAHNLRSPLGVITMYVNMMQLNLAKAFSNPPEDPLTLFEQLEDVEVKAQKILGATERIERIINDIMDYHQMNQDILREVVDINTVLRADAAILQADLDLKHRVSTRIDLAPGHLWVKMRAHDLSQIFLNLVSNARDAMLESEIRVMTIRSGVDEKAKSAWFEIHDTGKGVPGELLGRLGDPFFTTKTDDHKARERGSGTGLGLYMVKRQLDQCDGKLEVVSVSGDTTFRVMLPEVSPPEAMEQESE